METANLAGARRQPSDALDAKPAKPESEIDLDRIIYDPVYREEVRDQLNRARIRPGRDEGK